MFSGSNTANRLQRTRADPLEREEECAISQSRSRMRASASSRPMREAGRAVRLSIAKRTKTIPERSLLALPQDSAKSSEAATNSANTNRDNVLEQELRLPRQPERCLQSNPPPQPIHEKHRTKQFQFVPRRQQADHSRLMNRGSKIRPLALLSLPAKRRKTVPFVPNHPRSQDSPVSESVGIYPSRRNRQNSSI